jgi:hypothetical protein
MEMISMELSMEVYHAHSGSRRQGQKELAAPI